jgi:hypothetical protein
MLDVVDGCAPGMNLDGPYFDQPEKTFDAVDPQAHAFAALALLDAELVHGARDREQGAFVEVGRAMAVNTSFSGRLPRCLSARAPTFFQ